MKKYAVFNEDGYKVAGYLEDYPSIPAEAIEITDEEETLYNNGYIRVDGRAVLAPEILPTLEEVKAEKIENLKNERDTLEVEPIEYNGNSFDYDEKARERINVAMIALELQGEDATISWTTATNTEVVLTANDFKMIIAMVAQRSNTLHVAYRQAKERVEEATTIEEVNEVTLLGE